MKHEGEIAPSFSPECNKMGVRGEKNMNMKMIAGACLCATAIVGCVSLEERLASTDPAVRKEAEQDLLCRQNYVFDAKARMDAVKRVQDEEVLCNFAMTIADPQSERYQDRRPEAMAAMEKITRDELLAKIAMQGSSAQIKAAAFSKIKEAGVRERTKNEMKRRAEQAKAMAWAKIKKLREPNAYYEGYTIYRRADMADRFNYLTDDRVGRIVSELCSVDLSDEDNAMNCVLSLLSFPEHKVNERLEHLAVASVNNVKDPKKIKRMLAAWDEASCRNSDWRMIYQEVNKALKDATARCYSGKDLLDLLCDQTWHAFDGNEQMQKDALAKFEDPNELILIAKSRGGWRLAQEMAFKKIVERANAFQDEKALEEFLIGIQPWGDIRECGGIDIDQAKEKYKLDTALNNINEKTALARIAFVAGNGMISKIAQSRLTSDAYISGLAYVLHGGMIKDSTAGVFVEKIEDGRASVELYDSTTNSSLKKIVFEKMNQDGKKAIRNRNREYCEKIISAAREKGKETFELGGFYLGMNIADVDKLVGYYCPEWSNSEGYVDDDKTVRGLFVPQQKGAFCRADKDGKVFEFNFGKNFLKNFYKFDVQNEREWAAAYSRKEGVDLRHVYLNEDVEVVDYNDPGIPYHALYSQDTYTYKNNSKDYRITYFGEEKISAGNGIVKQAARGQMRYVGGQQGMLRVRIERD